MYKQWNKFLNSYSSIEAVSESRPSLTWFVVFVISAVAVVGAFEREHLYFSMWYLPVILSVVAGSISTFVWCCADEYGHFIWRGIKRPNLMGICQFLDVFLFTTSVVFMAVMAKSSEASCALFLVFFYMSLKYAYNFSWSIIGLVAVNGGPIVLSVIFCRDVFTGLLFAAAVLMWRQVSKVTEEMRGNRRVAREQSRTLQHLEDVVDACRPIGLEVGTILHEMNNLLGPIGMELYTILQEDHLEDEDRKSLEACHDNWNQIVELTGEILTCFRNEKSSSFFSLKNAGMLRKNGRLYFWDNEEDGLPDVYVFGTAVRIQSILRNLVKNAMEAKASEVIVQAVVGDDSVRIEVTDDGTGFHPEAQERLFERGATVGKQGGTGLGLWLSRFLARSMGGDLELDWTKRDYGSKFVLTLKRKVK
jgi:signal transduction histidine kinase